MHVMHTVVEPQERYLPQRMQNRTHTPHLKHSLKPDDIFSCSINIPSPFSSPPNNLFPPRHSDRNHEQWQSSEMRHLIWGQPCDSGWRKQGHSHKLKPHCFTRNKSIQWTRGLIFVNLTAGAPSSARIELLKWFQGRKNNRLFHANDSVADVPSFTIKCKEPSEPEKGIPQATSMLFLSQAATPL